MLFRSKLSFLNPISAADSKVAPSGGVVTVEIEKPSTTNALCRLGTLDTSAAVSVVYEFWLKVSWLSEKGNGRTELWSGHVKRTETMQKLLRRLEASSLSTILSP